jgi:hypothetical protein
MGFGLRWKPVVQRPLISTAQDVFTTDITLPILDTAELTERKDHLEYFAVQLAKFARHVVTRTVST